MRCGSAVVSSFRAEKPSATVVGMPLYNHTISQKNETD
jgi:hypothetical protein